MYQVVAKYLSTLQYDPNNLVQCQVVCDVRGEKMPFWCAKCVSENSERAPTNVFRNLYVNVTSVPGWTSIQAAQSLLASQMDRAEQQQASQLNGYCAKAAGTLRCRYTPEYFIHTQTSHNAPSEHACVIVTMACINPFSASSQIAPNSRACLRHHAVLSGMLWGTIVPYHFENASGPSATALPNCLRPSCEKNNAFLIDRSILKK